MWDNWNSHTFLVAVLVGTNTLGNYWAVLVKRNICTPYNGAILFSGIYPTEMPTYVHQKPCSRMFLSALLINNPRLVTCNSDERHQIEKKKKTVYCRILFIQSSEKREKSMMVLVRRVVPFNGVKVGSGFFLF